MVEAVKAGVMVVVGRRLSRTVKLKSSGNAEAAGNIGDEVRDTDSAVAACFPLNEAERVLIGFSSPVSGSITRGWICILNASDSDVPKKVIEKET